jgi:hypothetical protein
MYNYKKIVHLFNGFLKDDIFTSRQNLLCFGIHASTVKKYHWYSNGMFDSNKHTVLIFIVMLIIVSSIIHIVWRVKEGFNIVFMRSALGEGGAGGGYGLGSYRGVSSGTCKDVASSGGFRCETGETLAENNFGHTKDMCCARPPSGTCAPLSNTLCTGVYKPKPGIETLNGNTVSECCQEKSREEKTCQQNQITCTGAALKPNYNTLIGSSPSVCCEAVIPPIRQTCAALKANPANTCDAGTFPNVGMLYPQLEVAPTQYKEQCCTDNPWGTCTELQAAIPGLGCDADKKLVATASGKRTFMTRFKTDCCEPKKCPETMHTCPDGWTPKPGFDTLDGTTVEQCCTREETTKLCSEITGMTCDINQIQTTNTNARTNANVTQESYRSQCCESRGVSSKMSCFDWSKTSNNACNSNVYDGLIPNANDTYSSTAAECCAPKMCLQWYIEEKMKTENRNMCSRGPVDDATTKPGTTVQDCCKETPTI